MTTSESSKRRRRRAAAALASVTGAALLILTASPVPIGYETAAAVSVLAAPASGAAAPVAAVRSVAEVQYQDALDSYEAQRLDALREVAVAASHVASAQLALDSSAGKLLSDETAAALRQAILGEQARVDLANDGINNAYARLDAALTRPFSAGPEIHEATAIIDRLEFGAAAELGTVRANLEGPVTAVKNAVTAWEAEQARIAAAAEAARVAAEAAARAAAEVARAAPGQASVVSGVPGGSGGGGGAVGKYVWTSGWQAEIDACRGAVDITGHYGVGVIAEHWSCGGSRFPSGGLITLSGALAGTYRVGGIVAILNQAVDSASDIPTGYDLLYQTCINGSNARMSFTVLTRVG